MKTFILALVTSVLSIQGLIAQDKSTQLQENNLKSMLENLGYDPKPVALEHNRTGYYITIKFQGYDASMFMQISPNNQNVWGTIQLSELTPEQATESGRLVKLLQLNQKFGPCHFYIRPDGKMICITRAIGNKNVAAKDVREQIESLINTASDTIPDWNTKNWKSTVKAPNMTDRR